MYPRLSLLAWLLAAGTLLPAQPEAPPSEPCTCPDLVTWALDAFEINDAGYQALLLQESDNPHAEARAELIAAASGQSINDCGPMIYDYLTLFRPAHIGFRPLRQFDAAGEAATPTTDEEIRVRYADAERYVKPKQPTADVLNISGEYASGSYRVRAEPTGAEPARYVGYITEADGVYWQPGQVKFTLNQEADGSISSEFRMRDHSIGPYKTVYRVGEDYLQIGPMLWTQTTAGETAGSVEEYQVAAAQSDRPYLYRYDQTTVVIRFPNFWPQWSDYTDSLVAANHELLTQSPNLVVDLRNNGGGSDRTYQSIMRLITTRTGTTNYDVSFLNTDYNRTSLQNYLDPEQFPQDIIDYARREIEQLENSPPGFVVLDYGEEDDSTPEVYRGRYPARVAVLVNRYCGSSGEQFALDARESWKVKLFGEPTWGGIDASNLQYFNDPCGNYQLTYATTVTSRAAIVPIDGIGVQPDYPLDLSGNPYEVIGEVVRLMKE